MDPPEKPAKDIAKKIKEEDIDGKSKEELIDLIKELRKENLNLVQRIGTIENQNKKKDVLRYKSKKNVDDIFANSTTKKVAFKICYMGEKYFGFASQPHVTETIEEKFFDALKHTLLIKDRESWCGRTDKGVSALGNVLAFKLRAKRPDPNQKDQKDFEYMKMVNGCLPPDIRVLSAAFVHDDFNARYDCKYRTYRYFFLKGGMNIEVMRQAAQKFIGEHDFRNFCKLNITDTVSFKRMIWSIEVDRFDQVNQTLVGDDRLDVYAFTIKGTSFLWHQIRCMVAVLFLIGKKLEEPSIIDDLLDIEKYPGMPQYNMAPEKNLVLYDCEFENLKFEASYENCFKVYEHFKDLVVDKLFDIILYSTVINQVGSAKLEENPNKRHAEKFLEDEELIEKNHKRIKDRPLALTLEESVGKLKGKKLEQYNKKKQNTDAYLSSLDNGDE